MRLGKGIRVAGPIRSGVRRPGYPRLRATGRPVNRVPVPRAAIPGNARDARDSGRRRRVRPQRAGSAVPAVAGATGQIPRLRRASAEARAEAGRARARVPPLPEGVRAAPPQQGAATRQAQSPPRTMSSTRAACAASTGRAPPISQSARSGSGCSSSHSNARRDRASAAGQPRSSQRSRSTSSSFMPRRQCHLRRPCCGSCTTHSSRSTMRRLMSAIARAGFRSFGQASVQFMIVWQR